MQWFAYLNPGIENKYGIDLSLIAGRFLQSWTAWYAFRLMVVLVLNIVQMTIAPSNAFTRRLS